MAKKANDRKPASGKSAKPKARKEPAPVKDKPASAKPAKPKELATPAEAAAPARTELKTPRVVRKQDDTPPPPAVMPTPSATFIF